MTTNEKRKGLLNGREPNITVVAEHINTNAVKTNCQYVGGVLTFKLTAEVGGVRPATETRTVQVVPRPVS